MLLCPQVRLFVSAAARAYLYSAFEPDEVDAMEVRV
jgi:hypothetical protein